MTGCKRKLMANLGLLLFLASVVNSLGVKEPEQNVTETTKAPIVLTGDPQKDYIHDPNLPRELNYFDLSDYPFYKRVPNVKFNFSCDDRHDGFYASIPHKCQVYHNCLFGVRYDFLCANYTMFDQTNFNCNFAHEVDCKNSEMYYSRNEDLYTTTTTTTSAPIIKIVYRDRPRQQNRRPNRKRPTAAPEYEYYYDQDPDGGAPLKLQPPKSPTEEPFYDYYDEPAPLPLATTTTTQAPRVRINRPQRTRTGGRPNTNRISQRVQQSEAVVETDFARQPQPPQVGHQNPPERRRRKKKKRRKKITTTTTTTAAPEYEYEYYYYDDEVAPTTTTTTAPKLKLKKRRRPPSRPSAKDRQAAAQLRRQQLISGTSLQSKRAQEPAPAVEESISYYDDLPVDGEVQYADYEVAADQVRAGTAIKEEPLQNQEPQRQPQRQPQIRRRPQQFRGTRN